MVRPRYIKWASQWKMELNLTFHLPLYMWQLRVGEASPWEDLFSCVNGVNPGPEKEPVLRLVFQIKGVTLYWSPVLADCHLWDSVSSPFWKQSLSCRLILGTLSAKIGSDPGGDSSAFPANPRNSRVLGLTRDDYSIFSPRPYLLPAVLFRYFHFSPESRYIM